MPWVLLSDETKRAIREAATLPFIASERPSGEIFIDSEVYKALHTIGRELGLDFDATIQLMLANHKGNLS